MRRVKGRNAYFGCANARSCPHPRSTGRPPSTVGPFSGLLVVLGLQEGRTYYELGDLMAPWLFIWVVAVLALAYDGRARGGVRISTIVVLVFVLIGSLSRLLGASAPGEFLNAALRIVFGVPTVVLLGLPQATAWFDRQR